MRIDVDYVVECLKNEKYEEAIDYLDNIKLNHETRLGNQLLRMIVTMNRINKFNKYEYPKTNYENPKELPVARLYEALKFKDFKEANNIVDSAIEYLKERDRAYEEMEAYKKALVYANEVQQRTIKRSKDLTRMSDITHEIELYVRHNDVIKFESLEWLHKNINEIIQISESVNRPSTKMQYASELITTIVNFSDNVYRDENYFGNVCDYKGDHTRIDKMYTQLLNGQYPDAYNSLRKYIIDSNRKVEWIYKLYYMLLSYLKEVLNTYKKNCHVDSNYIAYNQLFNDVLKDKKVNDPELLANLVLIKSLEKR